MGFIWINGCSGEWIFLKNNSYEIKLLTCIVLYCFIILVNLNELEINRVMNILIFSDNIKADVIFANCRLKLDRKRSLLLLHHYRKGQPPIPNEHFLRTSVFCSLPMGLWLCWRCHRISSRSRSNVNFPLNSVQ